MARVSFWDGIDEDSGEKRLDIARMLYDQGTSLEDIAEQMSGPLTTLESKLWPDSGTVRSSQKKSPEPSCAVARDERSEKPALEARAQESETPMLDRASKEDLRGFLVYRHLEKTAEWFLSVAAFVRSRHTG